ncbi:hypothetical protein D3C76_1816380 [compost metagenome]
MRDAVGGLFDEAAGLGGACVVDQDADAVVIAQAGFNFVQVADLGQVGLEHVDGHGVFVAQFSRQCF